MSNLAEYIVPLVDQHEDAIQVVIEVFSAKENAHVAYQLSHKELRDYTLGKLDFNGILGFMLERLRDHNGEEA